MFEEQNAKLVTIFKVVVLGEFSIAMQSILNYQAMTTNAGKNPEIEITISFFVKYPHRCHGIEDLFRLPKVKDSEDQTF